MLQLMEKAHKTLETATYKRLEEAIAELTKRFDWFAALSDEKKMELALKVINMDKVGLQKIRFVYDLFIHLVPWIVTMITIILQGKKW